MEKPTSVDEFLKWAEDCHSFDFSEKFDRVYKANLSVAENTLQEFSYFKGLDDFLKSSDQALSSGLASDAFITNPSLKLKTKSCQSVRDKLFRINVLNNANFPDAPEEGWVTPDNVFFRIDDLIRGTLVCKYFDGPKLLVEKLSARASDLGLVPRAYSHEKDTGYYAYHFYVKVPVELMDLNNESYLKGNLEVEIQVTTQLQDVLYNITHKFYNQERIVEQTDRDAWKWNLGSERFKAAYMAHTLHMLEAIIVELRDRASGFISSSGEK